MFVPRVVDVSHYSSITDLRKTAAAGIYGVICKCTQGTSNVDASYDDTRQKTLDAGMLFGAYHFGTDEDINEQLHHFLEHAKLDSSTLPCLDFEDYSSQMSAHQMVEFLRVGEKEVGRKFVIYSGNTLKEAVDELSEADLAYVCSHKLWLADYSNSKLPKGFTKYWLWQYTGDGMGPGPHSVPGIAGNQQDLNVYDGTKEQLTADWVGVTPQQVSFW
jgi:lysozyme